MLKNNMKKIVLLVVLFILWISFVYAQDLIVLRDGTTIEAKIQEVSPTEIKFLRADNLEGPVRTILKSDVNLIMYDDRTLEIFKAERSQGNQQFGNRRYTAFAGMSLANHGGDVSGLDSKVGFINIGASVWLPDLIPNTIMEPGIRLVSKGSKSEVTTSSYGGDITTKNTDNLVYLELFGKARLDMLDMPILPFAGLSAGFLLSANRKTEVNGQSEDVDLKDTYNTMDFGLLFGLDYVINNKMTVGFEYNLGLANMLDGPGKMTNNTMLFTIGVLFK